jgi:hypothetical protein
MKYALSQCLRRSIAASFIDIPVVAIIGVSLMASAQSSTTVLNREAELFYGSSDRLHRSYDADRYASSSIPKHDIDIVESGKWNYDGSSSAPIEIPNEALVRASAEPSKPNFGGIYDAMILPRVTPSISEADHQRPRSLPRLDQILLVGVAAVRLEDAVTTPLLFKNGAQEDFLPDTVARSPVYMLSLGALATSAQYRLSAALIRHNHGRIARATELIHILSVGYFATQNIPAHEIYVNR